MSILLYAVGTMSIHIISPLGHAFVSNGAILLKISYIRPWEDGLPLFCLSTDIRLPSLDQKESCNLGQKMAD